MLSELLVVFLISAVSSKSDHNACTLYYWKVDWHSAVEACAQDNKRLLCYESKKEIDDITEAFRIGGYNEGAMDVWISNRDCSSQNTTECLSLHVEKTSKRVWHYFQEQCSEKYPFICCTKDSGPPVFEETYEEVSLVEGCKAEVWCRASGDEPLQYVWHDEFSNEITSDRNYSVYSLASSNGSALIFDVPSLHHWGLYTCSAKNIHGLESKVYNVSVYLTKDEAVKIQFVNILKITDVSVTFSFNVSGKPLGYIVTYIESLERSARTLDFAADRERRLEIEVGELIPSGRYKFRFQAKSALTVTEWTPIQEIVLLPEAPEVIFQSLGSGALGIGWSRIDEDINRKTIDEYKLSYGFVSQGKRDCVINITIPACAAPSYTIAGLSNNARYDFNFTAHTKSGYGKSTNFKIKTE